MLPSLDFAAAKRPDLDVLSSEDRFAVIASWFLGPRAENRDILANTFDMVVGEIATGRELYYPEDPVSLTH